MVIDKMGRTESLRLSEGSVWKDAEKSRIYETDVDFGLDDGNWEDWDGFTFATTVTAETFSPEDAAAVVAVYEQNHQALSTYGFIIARGDEDESFEDDFTDNDD